MTRSTSASAISVFAKTRRCSSGTPTPAQRSGSLAHASGRNRRSPTGIGTSHDPLLVQVVQDWLDEFERVQWLLRLSTRLRQKHGD